MQTNNHTTLDLKKVAYANFYWTNGTEKRREKPDHFTVHGTPIHPTAFAPYHRDYPNETEVERAKRLLILDVWYPKIVFQLCNSHTVGYTGKKALALRDAWNAMIFGGKKSSKKK